MSDTSSESASAPDASSPSPGPIPAPDSQPPGPWFAPAGDPSAYQPWPGSGTAYPFPGPGSTPTQPVPQRPTRMRGPLIGFIAGAVAVGLGLGAYLVAHNLSASRSNTPVATSSQGKSGGVTVTGHGITMTFPAGWVNVPTTPTQFGQFVKDFEDKTGHIPAALKSEINDPQLLNKFAMLVFNDKGTGVENLNALVAPFEVPPSQMAAELKSGAGPAQFGATNVRYTVTKFGNYPSLLITYTLRLQGMIFYGAQSYLDGPGNMVVTTVTSQAVATSAADLRKIVDTIRFT